MRADNNEVAIHIRLRQARLRQYPKVTQADAALLVDRSVTQYGDYERGTVNPPDEILVRLANLWGAPELLTGVTIGGLPREGLIVDWGFMPCGAEWSMPAPDSNLTPVPIEHALPDRVSVTVAGDSMSPTLMAGDRLIVRLTKSPPPGSIVLVRSTEGEMVIKRYRYVQGKPMLLSDNVDYPPADTRDCEFVGQIIALYQRDLTLGRA